MTFICHGCRNIVEPPWQKVNFVVCEIVIWEVLYACFLWFHCFLGYIVLHYFLSLGEFAVTGNTLGKDSTSLFRSLSNSIIFSFIFILFIFFWLCSILAACSLADSFLFLIGVTSVLFCDSSCSSFLRLVVLLGALHKLVTKGKELK